MLKKIILNFVDKLGYTLLKKGQQLEGIITLDKLRISQMSIILDKINYFEDKIKFVELYKLDDTESFYVIKNNTCLNQATVFYIQNKVSDLRLNFDYNQKKDLNKLKNKYNKIHYGSGENILKDWLNTDFIELDFENYLKLNLCDKQPFEENSFSFAFSEDFLEHINQDDSILFLTEAYNVLKVGGVLRLSFPGLEGVLKKHFRKENVRHFNLKLEAYKYWDHIHFYSKEELVLVATSIGFTKIEFVEYGKSNYKELQNLDTRDTQIGLNTYVELTK